MSWSTLYLLAHCVVFVNRPSRRLTLVLTAALAWRRLRCVHPADRRLFSVSPTNKHACSWVRKTVSTIKSVKRRTNNLQKKAGKWLLVNNRAFCAFIFCLWYSMNANYLVNVVDFTKFTAISRYSQRRVWKTFIFNRKKNNPSKNAAKNDGRVLDAL